MTETRTSAPVAASVHRALQPEGWARPIGYANGIEARGRTVFIGGQIGWNGQREFEAHDLSGQVRQTLQNIIDVLAVARTIVLANETSAIQPFVTGTIYSDFGDDQEVTFTDDMNPGVLTATDNLGTFGELSAGLNYRSILNGDGGLREMAASIRADLTFSDRVLGGRLVGQWRLQF